MRWTEQDQQLLIGLVNEQKTLEEIAAALNRSPDAISMKLRRLGLQATESSSLKKITKKDTETATTTTQKLEIVKVEELASPNEAMGLLWAALRRLQEPDVSNEEAKRLRLVIQGAKNYIHLNNDYLVPVRRHESLMLSEWKHFAANWKVEMENAKTPELKAEYEEEMHDAEQHVKELMDAGIRELPYRKKYGSSME